VGLWWTGLAVLDHTGTVLYDVDVYSDCANNAYQFFAIGGTTGSLNYLGVSSAASPLFDEPLSFIKNNEYGYGSICITTIRPFLGLRGAAMGR